MTTGASMSITDMRERSHHFALHLKAVKEQLTPQPFQWYAYDILANLIHFDNLLTGDSRNLLALCADRPILDIGGADGDLSFFFETLGCKVQFLDNPPTSNNGLKGVRTLRSALNSAIEIFEVDLDSQFVLPRHDYGLVLFLGTLYHLKNPFFALETISRASRFCIVSTKIARFSSDRRTQISDLPVAYLLDDFEANNDNTNYWIFSEAGLRRILKRSGWEILDFMRAGNTTNSDPASPEGDERAFCLLRSLKTG